MRVPARQTRAVRRRHHVLTANNDGTKIMDLNFYLHYLWPMICPASENKAPGVVYARPAGGGRVLVRVHFTPARVCACRISASVFFRMCVCTCMATFRVVGSNVVN